VISARGDFFCKGYNNLGEWSGCQLVTNPPSFSFLKYPRKMNGKPEYMLNVNKMGTDPTDRGTQRIHTVHIHQTPGLIRRLAPNHLSSESPTMPSEPIYVPHHSSVYSGTVSSLTWCAETNDGGTASLS
jgi:hypothetical protein